MAAADFFQNKKFVFYFFLVTFFSAAIFVASGVLHYSPIPFWDAWTGNVNFNVLVSAGEYSSWWALHNEHRIVLSKLFFWMDENWFGGSAKFLFGVNYALLIIIVFVFHRIAKAVEIEARSYMPIWLKLLGLMFLISWVQRDNLVWSFQSQFFLAQLLPLMGFYSLHLSERYGWKFFLAALFFGVASVGSMANGIIALPLMVVFSLLARFSFKKTFLLLLLSSFCIAAYFYQYVPYQGKGAFSKALIEQPLEVAQFLLLYLGSPFYRIFGQGEIAQVLVSVMSALLIFMSAWCFIKLYLRFRQHTLALSLLVFIIYIGGAGFGSAAGRVVYGVEAAGASRYTTPAILLWVSFVLLLWLQVPRIHRYFDSVKIKSLAVIFSILLLGAQAKALKVKPEREQERFLAALAVTVGANDAQAIHRIHWNSKELLELIGPAKSQYVSVFGIEPFRFLQEEWGEYVSTDSAKICKGYIDTVEALMDEKHFLKLGGWVADEKTEQVSGVGYVLDSNYRLSGTVLLGYPRMDVASVLGYSVYNGGFYGYIEHQAVNDSVSVFFPSLGCVLKSQVRDSSYSVSPFKFTRLEDLASQSQVVSDHEWKGSDYNHSKIEQINILGSYIRGDVDVAKVSLTLNRGQKILYRSGPVVARQFVTIGHSGLKQRLPVASEWMVLDFSSQHLPSTFAVTFTDDGDGWGEWSAIGVRSE